MFVWVSAKILEFSDFNRIHRLCDEMRNFYLWLIFYYHEFELISLQFHLVQAPLFFRVSWDCRHSLKAIMWTRVALPSQRISKEEENKINTNSQDALISNSFPFQFHLQSTSATDAGSLVASFFVALILNNYHHLLGGYADVSFMVKVLDCMWFDDSGPMTK